MSGTVHPLHMVRRGHRVDGVFEAVAALAARGESWGVCYCSVGGETPDECPVCLEELGTRLVIPCGHPVCVDCARRMVAFSVGSDKLSCAVCRRLFSSDELHAHPLTARAAPLHPEPLPPQAAPGAPGARDAPEPAEAAGDDGAGGRRSARGPPVLEPDPPAARHTTPAGPPPFAVPVSEA